MNYSAVLPALRGPFLILTPACVFLGISTVIAQNTAVNPLLASLVMLGALLAHISVNTFNEYFDLKSGLDLNTIRTPFSGGSGALPQNPEMAPAVLALAVASLLLTALIGLYLIHLHGWALAPLGVLGLMIIVAYTPWINRSALLCLVAPGLGFGLLMIAGTHFALTGRYTPLAWAAAGVPFFLVNNLLLLNQFPDLDADRAAGRRHLPIRWGTTVASGVYAGSALAAYAIILLAVAQGLFAASGLLALLSLPLAVFAWRGAVNHGERIGEHPAHLAANVATAVLTPILLGIGLML